MSCDYCLARWLEAGGGSGGQEEGAVAAGLVVIVEGGGEAKELAAEVARGMVVLVKGVDEAGLDEAGLRCMAETGGVVLGGVRDNKMQKLMKTVLR